MILINRARHALHTWLTIVTSFDSPRKSVGGGGASSPRMSSCSALGRHVQLPLWRGIHLSACTRVSSARRAARRSSSPVASNEPCAAAQRDEQGMRSTVPPSARRAAAAAPLPWPPRSIATCIRFYCVRDTDMSAGYYCTLAASGS